MNEKWVEETINGILNGSKFPKGSKGTWGVVKIGDGINVDNDGVISADRVLEVSVIPAEHGTITLSVPCVLRGGTITATISAGENYHIADVLIDGESVGAVGTYVFENIDRDHTIGAEFAENPIITVDTLEHGVISPSTTHVEVGGSQTFTIRSYSGWDIDSVLVDGVSVGALDTYTFTNVQSGHTISARFARAKIYSFKVPYGSVSDAVEYLEDAAGLTEAERRAVVRSLAKHAVVQNGVIRYWLDENDLSKKEDGTASNLTGTDGDVMLMYKPIFWKVTHVNDSYTTFRFSDYDFDEGNTACAHRYGDVVCSYLGLGVFEGIIQSSVLRSINVSSAPTVNTTNDAFYNAAVYGRTNITGVHYNQKLPLTWTLHSMLLIFEGGNINTQAKWGRGVVDKSWTSSWNGNNLNEGWNAGTPWARNNNSGTSGVTAGGIHNPWGNVWEFLGEFLKETNNLARFTVRGGSDHQLISASGHPSTWASVQMTGAHDGYVMDIIGDNNLPFLPRTKGGSDSTYWADYCYSSTSQRNCGIVGARWNYGGEAGSFYVYVYGAVGYSSVDVGARLQVLIE